MQRLTEAFDFASRHHHDQTKNGTAHPFLYHPLAVASLVMKFGGSDEQVQSALLHDTIADGQVTQAEIASRFGDEVARLVFAFADPDHSTDGLTGWRELKQAYLEKVRGLDEQALLVVACEELHDGSELLHDLRYQGVQVWKRYPVHGMEVFWYYRELLSIFSKRLTGDRHRALVGEFGSMMRALKGIIFEGSIY